tara:strand:+ start:296 stop:472 length:177 start_codon:yes stop_codon:yes gene_type:complete
MQTKKHYFVATKEVLMDAINQFEKKLIVIESNEDFNLSKEANKVDLKEVNYQINVLNI